MGGLGPTVTCYYYGTNGYSAARSGVFARIDRAFRIFMQLTPGGG